MIERKKKPCVQCLKEKYIFSKGRCQQCAKLVSTTVNKLKKKEEKESISSLKKKLDAVFSLWIRERGSKDGMNTCVTCGSVKPIKELQAGHFFSRRYLAIRYDEFNVWPQCQKCNIFQSGNMISYYQYMEEKYGKMVISNLNRKKDNTVKMTKEDYKLLIQKYEQH